MKARRRIAASKAQGLRGPCYGMPQLQQGFTTGEMGLGVSLHGSNPEQPMSALGQMQTLQCVCAMSALPPKDGVIGRRLVDS